MTQRTSPTVSHPTLTTVQLPTTMGLDLSDRVSHYHVQRGDGVKLVAGKVGMTREHLTALFQSWRGCRLVLEAGGHSPWISRLGHECGLEVVVANPRRVELISKSDRKTDRTDAELLTELGRTNAQLLAPIQHRSKEAQADLAVLPARDEVVRGRTAFINHVRGVLKAHGYRAPSVSSESFGARALDSIPAELTAALQPLLRLIVALNAEIKAYDKMIEQLATERYPITQLLRQICGVGPIVSLYFVLTLDDPKRFPSARDVGAYLGLVPRKQSSGAGDPQMHITKAGDREMRRLLVLAANYILGHDLQVGMPGSGPVPSQGTKGRESRIACSLAKQALAVRSCAWRTDP